MSKSFTLTDQHKDVTDALRDMTTMSSSSAYITEGNNNNQICITGAITTHTIISNASAAPLPLKFIEPVPSLILIALTDVKSMANASILTAVDALFPI